MTDLLRAISAEHLKLKNTLAIRLALAGPVLLVLLHIGIYLTRGEMLEDHDGHRLEGFARGIMTTWTLLFFPLWVALATALIASIDHRENHWDHLFALPIGRQSLYAAKWFVAAELTVLGSLAIPILGIAGAILLKAVHPDWRGEPLPAAMLFVDILRNSVAALLLLSIQFWLSLRWRSFVLPLAVGVGGILSAVVVIQAPMKYLIIYPWTTSAAAASPTHPVLALAWGLVGGLALVAAACSSLARRDEI